MRPVAAIRAKLGSDRRGDRDAIESYRRHAPRTQARSADALKSGTERNPMLRGQTRRLAVDGTGWAEVPPVMIYGDAITQIVTEKGIAHLHKCATLQEREASIKLSPATRTWVKRRNLRIRPNLDGDALLLTPADLGINRPRPRLRSWRPNPWMSWRNGQADWTKYLNSSEIRPPSRHETRINLPV